jgi:hypothetical protein
LGSAIVTTNRTPIDRPSTVRITERALDLWESMSRLRCTCLPVIPEHYWTHKQCASCRRWGDLQAELNDELQCEPWQWPCVARRASRKRAGALDWREQDVADRTAMLKAAAKARRAARKRKQEGTNADVGAGEGDEGSPPA